MQTQELNLNPDVRPLPAGWTQHFEPTKQLWYYVQTSVVPPKVSFTHPVDIVPTNRRPMNNTHMLQTQLAVPPMQSPRNPSQSGGGLTFAQQLYASSMSSSLGPMINSHCISHLPISQPPPTRIRNLPTPPPSSSPPPGTGAHFPTLPLDGSDMPPNPLGSQSSYFSHQTSSHAMNRCPSPTVNSTPSSAPPFPILQRMNTFQTPTLPSNNGRSQRHRAFTHDPGVSQHSVNVNQNPSTTGSRPTRHLVTMARPPDQQSSSDLSPLALELPVAVHSAPTVPSPPPVSSVLFSQTLTPPLTAVQSSSVTPPNFSSVLSVPSGTAYKPKSSLSSLGRVTSGAAIQIAGDAAQCLGVRFLADGVSGALQSVLLTPGTDIDQFSLQAVIQGRPDADYQRIINALIKLHQQQQHHFSLMKLQMPQPPPPAIDYQAMIDEVQRLQALAQQVTTAQHQQLAQLHAGAQLQAAQQQHVLQSPQQQQQQTAAQQYQALVQQRYQQQQHLQQVPAQQQQQQAAIQAQQNQALLNTYPQPPQQPPQIMQSTIQPYLFQHLNHQSPQAGGDTGGNQAQPSFDPISLY